MNSSLTTLGGLPAALARILKATTMSFDTDQSLLSLIIFIMLIFCSHLKNGRNLSKKNLECFENTEEEQCIRM